MTTSFCMVCWIEVVRAKSCVLFLILGVKHPSITVKNGIVRFVAFFFFFSKIAFLYQSDDIPFCSVFFTWCYAVFYLMLFQCPLRCISPPIILLLQYFTLTFSQLFISSAVQLVMVHAFYIFIYCEFLFLFLFIVEFC